MVETAPKAPPEVVAFLKETKAQLTAAYYRCFSRAPDVSGPRIRGSFLVPRPASAA
jgi:hypothetical protein